MELLISILAFVVAFGAFIQSGYANSIAKKALTNSSLVSLDEEIYFSDTRDELGVFLVNKGNLQAEIISIDIFIDQQNIKDIKNSEGNSLRIEEMTSLIGLNEKVTWTTLRKGNKLRPGIEKPLLVVAKNTYSTDRNYKLREAFKRVRIEITYKSATAKNNKTCETFIFDGSELW